MDNDSLFLAIAECELYDCIWNEKNKEWELLRSKDCKVFSDTWRNSFSRVCCAKHGKHLKKQRRLLKGEIECTEISLLRSKTNCCYKFLSKKKKFSCKGLNRPIFEDSGDGPIAKNRKVLDETKKVTSTNRGFRTKILLWQPTRRYRKDSLIYVRNE